MLIRRHEGNIVSYASAFLEHSYWKTVRLPTMIWKWFALQACGGLYEELQSLLTSLPFIHGKCKLGQATQLLDDYHIKGNITTRIHIKSHGSFFFNPNTMARSILAHLCCDYVMAICEMAVDVGFNNGNIAMAYHSRNIPLGTTQWISGVLSNSIIFQLSWIFLKATETFVLLLDIQQKESLSNNDPWPWPTFRHTSI